MGIFPAILFAARIALAAAPNPEVRAQRRESRAALQEGTQRLKRVTVEQHKELLLIREREKSDLRMVKASAASPETMHLALLDVREKSRRERLALRARGRAERDRLRRLIKGERERIVSLRRKK
ncbi:MAG: hypothetical protein HY923_01885 [Elusimicrobia bacterium]|nr:hypothetical protein [Elusimicrobiota bacterium]